MAESKNHILLVTGGSRSGKSRVALERALLYDRRVFIATAEAFDEEMRARIERHRAERGETFRTVEEPRCLAEALLAVQDADVILVDCLTVWLGNLMHYGGVEEEIPRFLDALRKVTTDVIIVTNEVGMGIIPHEAMTREYRDRAGFLNQDVAALADEVVLTVSGIPMTIKKLSDSINTH